MALNSKKLFTIFTVFTAASLVFETGLFPIRIQAADQQGSLVIEERKEILLYPPQNFSFSDTFAPVNNDSTTIYALLSPNDADQKLAVFDSDDTQGFAVTASVTSLTSSTNNADAIDMTNMAIVTLSENTSDAVDSGDSNSPSGAPNVQAPLFCNFDINDITQTLANTCDDSMTSFSKSLTAATALSSGISETDTSIFLDDASDFDLSGEVTIDDDLILYTAINGNELTGVTEISTAHTAGAIVNQYASASTPLTILQDSTVTDTGVYSVGTGFRLVLDDADLKGFYMGTITFDLILL